MKGRTLICILISAFLLITPRTQARGGLELLSRSLLQGPSRTVAFFDEGIILGTGGGMVIFSGNGASDYVFLQLEAEPWDIAVYGDAAYIATITSGILTVNISDPKNPFVTNRNPIPRSNHCCVSNGRLYVSSLIGGLYILDLSDPFEPEPFNEPNKSQRIISLSVDGDILVTGGHSKFEIFRIRETKPLKSLAKVKTQEHRGIILGGGVLYVMTKSDKVLRWDMADPANPEELSPISVDGISDLAVNGSRGLLLCKDGRIVPFETNDILPMKMETKEQLKLYEKKPSLISSIIDKFKSMGKGGHFPGNSIFMSGDHFATIDGHEGIFIYELDGSTALSLGNLPTRGFAIDLVAANGYVYLANARDGLRIGEVHEDGSVDWIGHLQTNVARDVALSGTTLVLADGNHGLKIIDVEDPSAPRLLGEHPSPYFLSAVVVRDEKAYLAGGLGGVEIVDFSDPAHPALEWRDEFSEVRGIEVDEDFIYFADGREGFRTYSRKEDPPASVSVLDTEGWNCDVFIYDDTACLADGGHGIKTADISDRSNPVLTGSLNLHTLTREIHALNGTLFAAGHTSGIKAIDITDPGSPSLAAAFRTVDDARGVFADDRFVYLASGSGGVYIFSYTR